MRATVLSISRRLAQVYAQGETHKLVIERKFSHLVPGDQIEIDLQENKILAASERKNLIKRSSQNKTKEIVANLDQFWLITAPPPLFNTIVIDRSIALAVLQDIDVCLVLNKNDLDYTEAQELINYYKGLNIDVIYSSAKEDHGLEQVETFIINNKPEQIALSGVSGVGKSSILKKLLDISDLKTSEVSSKTGQGRQTTSQAVGFVYQNQSNETLMFDLPGIQNFGLSHLDQYELKNGFTEFQSYASECEYKDCQHIAEPNCAVKNAVNAGNIISSRYNSYLQILKEIEAARPY